MDTGLLLFSALVFVSAFLLAEFFLTSFFGAERQKQRRLKRRLDHLAAAEREQAAATLLREEYSRQRPQLARWLALVPGFVGLETMLEQAGRKTPVHSVVVLSLILGAAGFLGVSLLLRMPVVGIAVGAGLAMLPFLQIKRERAQRLARFEEQLPEALDIVVRSLKAGHPFNESLLLVAEELQGPVAEEFGMAFFEINHGMPIKESFYKMMERTPSATLKVLVTSVLVQRETGGNLAEVLEKISSVIRARFRFQRKVRTLTAEGRMSGWVLVAVPFVLFGIMAVTSPDYALDLVREEMGRKMVVVALVLIGLGALWIRKLIQIEP
jgi:tight adherence protein B